MKNQKKKNKAIYTLKTIVIVILVCVVLSNLAILISKEREDHNTIKELEDKASGLTLENNVLSEEISSLRLENSRLEELCDTYSKDKFCITSEDFDLLARVVYLESNVEPYDGQVAVARVVLNRVNLSEWPSDIRSVVYQRGQFSQITGRIYSCNPTVNNYLAVIDALNNTIDMPVSVDSFESVKSGTQTSNKGYSKWKQIGNHVFSSLN